VADCVLLCHPFDDMVPDINRIKRHRYLSFLSGKTSCQSYLPQTLVLRLCRLHRDCCLLLNKPERIFTRA
jgi:hypothetical protein